MAASVATPLTKPEDLIEYGSRRVLITVLAVSCALLEVIDATIVNVAINDMAGSLGASINDIGWVITSYAIANVIIIPMTSWLSMQFGRRYYFAGSIILFTIASFLCGNSTGLWELVFFRFIQGLGGGALLVTSQTIITESYPLEKRGMALAIFGMGVVVGPTIGPPLGGFLIDHFSWPDIFYVNIPLGIIATTMTLTYLKSPKYGEKLKAKQVDWWGILCLAAFVGSLQYVLENGQQDDWLGSKTIIFFSILSILGLFFFIWRELVYEHPIVNLRVLSDKNLRVGVILIFVIGFGLFGSSFVVPVYTQAIMGWPATDAGLVLVPGTIATAIMMPFIGKMLEKGVSPKYIVATGFLFYFFFNYTFYYVITTDTGWWPFFWPLVLRGMGLGLLIVPTSTLALSTLKGKGIGEGASFINMMQQLGGSFGIAIITTAISRFTQHHRVELIPNLNLSNPEIQAHIEGIKQGFIAKGHSINESLSMAYKAIEGQVMAQATVLTYMDIFLYTGLLFAICIPLVLFFIKRDAGRVIHKK